MSETPPPSALYPPEVAALWRRIELGRPATYWEENVVEGRRAVQARLLAWMEPVAGRRILDAGCGYGVFARRLAAAEAVVTACDLRPAAIEEANVGATADDPSFEVADLRTLLAPTAGFDDVVLQEVLEDLGPQAVLEREMPPLLARCRAESLFIVVRTASVWSRLLEPLLPAALEAAVDPIALLRTLHLETPYRLLRQKTIQRRNFRAQLMQLVLNSTAAEGTAPPR